MPDVDEKLIAEVVGLMTGIPVSDLSEDDAQRLIRMEEEATQAGGWAGASHQGAVEGHPTHPRRSEGPQAPSGIIHLRRPVRCR